MEENKSSVSVWGIGAKESDTLFDSASEIQNYFDCHPLLAQVLWNRGFRSVQETDRFLKPELQNLPDPFSILNLDKAVERTIQAITESPQHIAIYGDYDVDGTCGTTLLFDFFRQIGIQAQCIQPNRFDDGYGVHTHLIEKLADQGIKLVLTVDCGITAVDPAKAAKARGMDMVILDHHKLGTSFPEEAYAVVDPQHPEDLSGLKNVCGTGLAFFFIMALRSELRKIGFFAEIPEPNLMKFLDLVAVATIADVMDVRGVNRILVAHGLKVMRTHPRVGFKAILEAASVTDPKAYHCGFVIGPRINAAGRLRDAKSALDLLTSTDLAEAKKLALELEEINTQRRAAQDQVQAEAFAQAQAQMADPQWKKLSDEIPAASFGPWPRALVLTPPPGKNWHEGVVGIVASRMVEQFGRPTFVLTRKESDSTVFKGSVRSLPKIDILSFISNETVAKKLINFGGHAHAGGVTLNENQLQDFIQEINIAMALSTDETTYVQERRFDLEIQDKDAILLNEKLLLELEKLEPYGHRFPEPTIRLKSFKAGGVQVLKEKHLRIQLESVQKGVQAMWFKALDQDSEVAEALLENNHDYWVSMQWNEWKGVRNLQLQIRHAEKQN